MKVLLVDDHAVFRRGIREILRIGIQDHRRIETKLGVRAASLRLDTNCKVRSNLPRHFFCFRRRRDRFDARWDRTLTAQSRLFLAVELVLLGCQSFHDDLGRRLGADLQ